jgi:DNA helicase II / ATP-dependent DNA helicase PcrA
LPRLTDEQRVVVNHNRSACIQACPGSGKTQTLVEKVATELEKLQQGPYCIAAITYTNNAAEEIAQRIEERLPHLSDRLWVGTIHSWCLYWVLHCYGSLIPEYRFGLKILDERQSGTLLKEFVDLPNDEDSTGILRDHLTGRPFSEAIDPGAAEQYWTHLRDMGAVDFSELLYLTYCILAENSAVAAMISARMPWILVDEFQDTSRLQFEILRLVVSSRDDNPTKIMFFGDTDQSIYMTGYCPSPEEFQAWYGIAEADILRLTGNFRSSTVLTQFTHPLAVSGNMMEARGTARDWPSRPWVFGRCAAADQDIHVDRLGFLVHRFITSQMHKHGFLPNQIAVLCPRRYVLRELMQAVAAAQEQDGDRLYTMQCPGIAPLPNIWSNPLRYLSEFLLTERSPAGVIKRRHLIRRMLKLLENGEQYAVSDFIRICNAVTEIPNGALTAYLRDSFERIFTAIGGLQVSQQPIDSMVEPYLGSVGDRLARWEILDDCHVAASLLEANSGVQFETIHGSKGKQYEAVLVFGVLRDWLPDWRRVIADAEQAELEGKRLLYVAMTRAKRELVVVAESGRQTTRHRPRPPSPIMRFVRRYQAE